jgi:hypothetical protein
LSGQCKSCRRATVSAYHKRTNYAANKRYLSKNGKAIHNRINRVYYGSEDGKSVNRAIKIRTIEQFLKYKLANIKARAEWPIDIDIQFLTELYQSQDGRCKLSGIKLTHTYNSLRSISIDRIDSSVGYTRDNVQLICRALNLAKQKFSNADMIDFVNELRNVSI